MTRDGVRQAGPGYAFILVMKTQPRVEDKGEKDLEPEGREWWQIVFEPTLSLVGTLVVISLLKRMATPFKRLQHPAFE